MPRTPCAPEGIPQLRVSTGNLSKENDRDKLPVLDESSTGNNIDNRDCPQLEFDPNCPNNPVHLLWIERMRIKRVAIHPLLERMGLSGDFNCKA